MGGWIFDSHHSELCCADCHRRIIQCSIVTKDYGTAAEVFNSMSSTTQEAPISRFLMFKVALRTSDDDLGRRLPAAKSGLES